MKTIIIALTLTLGACTNLTETQKNAIAFGAAVVVVGVALEHQSGSEHPQNFMLGHRAPCYPQPNGSCL